MKDLSPRSSDQISNCYMRNDFTTQTLVIVENWLILKKKLECQDRIYRPDIYQQKFKGVLMLFTGIPFHNIPMCPETKYY